MIKEKEKLIHMYYIHTDTSYYGNPYDPDAFASVYKDDTSVAVKTLL
jgi:hypothetical protein